MQSPILFSVLCPNRQTPSIYKCIAFSCRYEGYIFYDLILHCLRIDFDGKIRKRIRQSHT